MCACILCCRVVGLLAFHFSTFAHTLLTAQDSQACNKGGTGSAAFFKNDTVACFYNPDLLLDKQLTYWNHSRFQRRLNGLPDWFIDEVLGPLDEIDLHYKALILHKHHTCPAGTAQWRNLTKAFCKTLPESVWHYIKLTAYGHFLDHRFSNPDLVRNLFYKIIVTWGDAASFNRLAVDRGVLSIPEYEKLPVFTALPFFWCVISIDILTLRRMLQKSASSTFAVHLWLCYVDLALSACFISAAYPIFLIILHIDVFCSFWEEKIIEWPTVHTAMMLLEITVQLKVLLCGLLSLDRTCALFRPQLFKRRFSAAKANRTCRWLAFLNLLTVLIFMTNVNDLFRYWPIRPKWIENTISVVSNVMLHSTTASCAMFQVLVALPIALKLLFRKKSNMKRHGADGEDGKMRQEIQICILVLCTALFNALTYLPHIWLDAVGAADMWSLAGFCDRGLLMFGKAQPAIRIYMQVASRLTPLSNCCVFALHCVFSSIYRKQFAELLRLRKVAVWRGRAYAALKKLASRQHVPFCHFRCRTNRIEQLPPRLSVSTIRTVADRESATYASSNL